MKISRSQLRQIIREVITSGIGYTIEEQGMLGKYVWPSAIAGHPMADEPDTEIETLLYQQLHNHFGAIAPLNDRAITAIQNILNSGEYTNVFSRCMSGRMFRGMRVTLPWLEEYAPEALVNLPTAMKDPIDWGSPIAISPKLYRPAGKYGKVSSWTGLREAARIFTTLWSANTVPVILHSNCDSGYFMSTRPFKRYKGGIYKDMLDIKKLNPNAHENEVLLFGECLITAIEINATVRDIAKLRSKLDG